MYFFLLSYSVLGAGIKFIDSAYDEKTFNKKIAMVLAPFLGLLWTYTMFISPFSATILLSIIIGVLFKGKIDNFAHLSGVLVIFPLIFFLGVELLFIPLLFLTFAATLDEMGNDMLDKNSKQKRKSTLSRFIEYFFDQRWMLKSALFFLSLVGLIPFAFFIAMIFFDYSYLAVRYASEIKQGRREGFGQFDIKLKSIFPQKILTKN
jgi:hypothetical protein